MSTERETRVIANLRADADLTEKAIEFMADSEQVEEAQADISLWREAANLIEAALPAVLRESADE